MTRILILGEAYGEDEDKAQTPFVGKAGWYLNQLLEASGISRLDCHVTNVFNIRPQPTDDITNLCASKKEGGIVPGWPELTSSKYIRTEFAHHLPRLQAEINEVKPNLILSLGGTALWALTGNSGITRSRGAICESVRTPMMPGLNPVKVLPTFHPANLLRDPSNREITILDFVKAERESHFPEIRRPRRFIHIEPTLPEIWDFTAQYLLSAQRISIDIETVGNQITCIGFAPTTDRALVIPFCDLRKPGGSYWPTEQEEHAAWNYVRGICLLPAEKLFQNGLYDMAFLWRRYGIHCNNVVHDTMLLHHALQPELPKGLGFMGSLYTNEASWKIMGKKSETIKREG